MRRLEPGEIFEGRYRVEQVLGQGGFSVVYLVTEAVTERQVALKVLNPSSLEPDAIQRFEREVRILAQLESPQTVQLLSWGVSRGEVYTVCEFVPGEDLSDMLARENRLDRDIVLHILRQLLLSLREAHNLRLIHRDLKPENVRVFERDGEPLAVKLLDFGISRASDDGHPSLTKTGELIGTPRYMSPEQLSDKPLTPASDVYSLGLLALEMLLGRDVLPGNRLSDQLDRMRRGALFSVSDAGQLDPQLLTFLKRMTAIRPADRFRNAAVTLKALDRLSRAQPARLAPVPQTGRSQTEAAPKTSTYWPAGVGIAALAVLAVAGWQHFKPGSPPRPETDRRASGGRPGAAEALANSATNGGWNLEGRVEARGRSPGCRPAGQRRGQDCVRCTGLRWPIAKQGLHDGPDGSGRYACPWLRRIPLRP